MRTPCLLPFGNAFVADNATIVGDVELGRNVSVWYGTVIRGDVASIRIGEGTNIQDLSLVHPQNNEDIEVGQRVVIGHNVMVHGRFIGSDSLIGMGAILLPGSRIGAGCIIGAGALVSMNTIIPDGSVAFGNPARVIRPVSAAEHTMIRETLERYIALVKVHLRPNTN